MRIQASFPKKAKFRSAVPLPVFLPRPLSLLGNSSWPAAARGHEDHRQWELALRHRPPASSRAAAESMKRPNNERGENTPAIWVHPTITTCMAL